MNLEELKILLRDTAEDINKISNIPSDMPFQDKVILVQVRQELYKVLMKILDLAEGKKVVKDKKDKYHVLT